MILPVKIETLMWLLPIVFMLHDFEEIIMFKPWMNANCAALEKRLPTWAHAHPCETWRHVHFGICVGSG